LTAEFEDCLAQKTGANIYPGMMFSLAKDRMESTKLWKIIRKMPKGALLHAHMDAMVDFDYLFDVLLATPGMHIYCNKSLSDPAALETASVKFKFLSSEKGMCLLVYLFFLSLFIHNGELILLQLRAQYGALNTHQERTFFSQNQRTRFLMEVDRDF
jgi:hypothetical protein